jgi:DNA-directed RNA polymerase subunit RPC12/RpoP
MIVVNQPELSQATAQVPQNQSRIITQQMTTNGTIEAKNVLSNISSIQQRTQAITPMGGALTLTPEEYAELMQRRLHKQAQQEAQANADAQRRAQQEAQHRAQIQQQQQQQQQLQEHQNIAVQVQKIVQSLEEEVDVKKHDSENVEMQLITPKMEEGEELRIADITNETVLQKQQKIDGADSKTTGRPFSCEQCGKKFLLKHHLTTHARVHTGKTKFLIDKIYFK